MTASGLKDATEDIDLAVGVVSEFEHVSRCLRDRGFEVTGEPTSDLDGVGDTLELQHPDRGIEVDLFDRQVVGKVRLTSELCDRAEQFWSGQNVTALVLSDEDMFLLKAVSGGDVGLDRRRDIEDMVTYAQRGVAYDVVRAEIENQRPFNTGAVEADQIRSGSHPLFAVERAVTSVAGLPQSFEAHVTTCATELEIEQSILRAVESDYRELARIRDRVESNVRSVSDDVGSDVEAGVDRLVEKEILERDGDTLREA